MADSGAAFTRMVPGFEFLEGLVKNAGAALPNVGQWIAPTLNPEEIEKRIEELRTVQFWLEQNARMLAATIQALEVQRMTLSTLKTMNVSVGELRDSLILRPSESAAGAERASVAGAAPAQPRPRAKKPSAAASAPSEGGNPPPAPAGVVDPMQWWTALTQQFTQLAASAIKDSAPAGAAAPVAPSADTAPKRAAPAAASAKKAPVAPNHEAAAAAPRKPPKAGPRQR